MNAQPQCRTLSDCNVDVNAASTPPVDVNDANYTYTVPQYLEWVVKDADVQWTQWFLQIGLKEPYVEYNIIQPGSVPFQSTCGIVVAANHPNAYYCPTDAKGYGAVLLPSVTFQQMWIGNIFGQNSGTKGDFGAAAVAAHEFGHHIQDEIMLQLRQTPPIGKNKELIADCFAGNWTTSLYRRAGLDDGDLDEAVNGLFAIGDPNATVQSHGTGSERVQALQIGLSGDPFSCLRAYWPVVVS